MSEQKLIETAQTIAGLLPRLARGLSSTEKDPADDLPLAQLRLCGILSEGPRPMSALSRALGVSLSALTQIADRLEKARLVKRIAEGNDRRVRCLQLTVRGEKMMDKRREARVHRVLTVLEPLAAQQREAVRASLQLLADACTAAPPQDKNGGRENPLSANAGEASSATQTKPSNGHSHIRNPRRASKSPI
jgi:DNA-binding MarR family transcriptional regulator